MSLQCDNLSGELQDQWSSSFFVEKKCESPLHCKGFSQFFSTKNDTVYLLM